MSIEPNPRVAAMQAYSLPDISAAGGLEPIVLAQNEHAWPPSPRVREAVLAELERGQLYPDSEWTELRAAIARVHGLEAGQILCGAGSMELMAILVQSYLAPGDRLLMSQFGYLFMRTLCKFVGATLDVATERDYRVDIDALIAGLRPETKLVFVVNPGNPCGSLIHNDEIRRLRAAMPDDVLLLVDEAYAEFVDAGFHDPLFDLVAAGNTVITRTFSKIYGLAGLRVGWGYFPPGIRNQVRKVQSPSSVSALSQAAACAAIEDRDAVDEARRAIAAGRDYLSGELDALGLPVVPSHTNFILVDFASLERAASAFQYLREHRLVVRPMGGYGLPACLRITIGMPEQMQLTANTLADWSRKKGS